MPLPSIKKVTEFSTVCPECKGTLWNTTSNLAEAMGIVHLTCENCKKSFAINTNEKKDK